MSLIRTEAMSTISGRRSHKLITAIVASLLTAGYLSAGCASSGKDVAIAPKSMSPEERTAAASSGSKKPTPQQEAARKKAEARGAAMNEANYPTKPQ